MLRIDISVDDNQCGQSIKTIPPGHGPMTWRSKKDSCDFDWTIKFNQREKWSCYPARFTRQLLNKKKPKSAQGELFRDSKVHDLQNLLKLEIRRSVLLALQLAPAGGQKLTKIWVSTHFHFEMLLFRSQLSRSLLPYYSILTHRVKNILRIAWIIVLSLGSPSHNSMSPFLCLIWISIYLNHLEVWKKAVYQST